MKFRMKPLLLRRRTLHRAWATGLALCCLCAQAQPFPPLAPAPSDPFGPGWMPGQAELHLTVPELAQWVLLRNASVAAARLQSQASAKLVEAEQALYEPVGFGRSRHEDYDRPRTYEEITQSLTNISKSSAIEQVDTSALGLRGKAPTGASYDVSYEMRRRQSNLLSTSQPTEYRGTLTVNLKQPLLRGRGRTATETDLRVAEQEQAIEQQKFIKQLLDTVGESVGLYWQLSRAQQTVQLRQRAVTSARDLRDAVQRLVQGGASPQVDLLETEVMLGTRQTDLVKAEQQLAEASARLRTLLNLGDTAYQQTRFLTADTGAQTPPALAALTLSSPAPDGLLTHWPAYQMALARHTQEQLRLALADNLARPELNVEAGYNLNSLQPGEHTAWSQISDRPRHNGWYVGLSFEMPIGNHGPQSRRSAQTLKTEAARKQLEAEAASAGTEWAIRVGQLSVAQRERQQLQHDVQIRQALLQAERANYEQGRSRLRALIETDDRVQESRLRLIEGEVRLRVAEVSVQALMGDLFDTLGIDVRAP